MQPLEVLVIEDVPELSRLLELTFELDGRLTSIGTATEPERALELATRHQPDVIVLDIGLGSGVDGLGLLPTLRKAAAGARIVVFSGRDDPTLKQRALELGAAQWVTKGGDVDELVEALLDRGDGDGPS